MARGGRQHVDPEMARTAEANAAPLWQPWASPPDARAAANRDAKVKHAAADLNRKPPCRLQIAVMAHRQPAAGPCWWALRCGHFVDNGQVCPMLSFGT